MTIKPATESRETFVTDTMGLVLWLEERKMPQSVKFLFDEVILNRINLIIPAMVMAEIGYLSEKGRIGLSLSETTLWAEKLRNVTISPVNIAITNRAFLISDITELHDRLIAATAAEAEVPLITNDPVIRASKFVKTIWSFPLHGQEKSRRLPDTRAVSSVRR